MVHGGFYGNHLDFSEPDVLSVPMKTAHWFASLKEHHVLAQESRSRQG